jgi:hypothetical protein
VTGGADASWDDSPVKVTVAVAASAIDRLQRELDRLRAENARLTRLLDLRGQDTAPAHDQLAVPAPALVTMASPTQDKLALYADRFRARTGVHAVRWENQRTGQAGWMPAVAGGWRKGTDRRSANHLPLTAQVVGAHLVGDAFVGLYPLLKDNTCHFLAADFDGPAAMLDALAYIKAARASGVPAALELSQSGRGGHVWVFFTDKVPASVARAVGTCWCMRRWCCVARWICARTTGCFLTRTCCPRAVSAI